MDKLTELKIQEIELDIQRARTDLENLAANMVVLRDIAARAENVYQTAKSRLETQEQQARAETDEAKRKEMLKDLEACREVFLTGQMARNVIRERMAVSEREYKYTKANTELFEKQGQYKIGELKNGSRFSFWNLAKAFLGASTLMDIRTAAQKINRS